MTPIDSKTDDKAPSTATAAHIEASGQAELDLSLETLSRDLVYVIRKTQARMGWENLPDIVLVGHSLGGAVITDVAKKGELGPNLLAYAVLDVVEGTLHFHHLYWHILNMEPRIRNGRSPKHGNVPLNTTSPVPIIIVRD
jgi:pimeloyl-ACP methyl ester carboxylesterase